MTTIQLNATRQEFRVIQKIAKRAVEIAERHDVEYDLQDALMDINACHSNGTPLRLDALLEADDDTFVHDVFGIRRHLNRETGKLENCFVPRLAAPANNGR